MINSKTLKFIRQSVRGICDHMVSRRLVTESKYRLVPDYEAGLNLNGTLKMKPFLYPMPARNAPDTQRAVYRRVKKRRSLAKLVGAR